ncbi:nitrilase-related carbon-nitrogen hydrolase, partial [Enterobacter hormaechei]
GRCYNAYAVCLPDGALHVHRKLHAFEHPALASGDRYTVFDTPWGVRVGVLICWDNNLVENARATALLGAEVLM